MIGGGVRLATAPAIPAQPVTLLIKTTGRPVPAATRTGIRRFGTTAGNGRRKGNRGADTNPSLWKRRVTWHSVERASPSRDRRSRQRKLARGPSGGCHQYVATSTNDTFLRWRFDLSPESCSIEQLLF